MYLKYLPFVWVIHEQKLEPRGAQFSAIFYLQIVDKICPKYILKNHQYIASIQQRRGLVNPQFWSHAHTHTHMYAHTHTRDTFSRAIFLSSAAICGHFL